MRRNLCERLGAKPGDLPEALQEFSSSMERVRALIGGFPFSKASADSRTFSWRVGGGFSFYHALSSCLKLWHGSPVSLFDN